MYSGIFFGASTQKAEGEYLLKMVQLVSSGRKPEANGVRENINDLVGHGEDHAMSFKVKDVARISFEPLSLNTQEKRQNGMNALTLSFVQGLQMITGSATSFRTDSDISGRKGGHERELQPWIPPEGTDLEESLESSPSTKTWDQFQANENLFGVRSDYDENYYTTRIDKSHPNYRQRAADAARIAQRMGESSKGEAEEAEGLDEEDKSGRTSICVPNFH